MKSPKIAKVKKDGCACTIYDYIDCQFCNNNRMIDNLERLKKTLAPSLKQAKLT